jgi:hypothetical protein
MKNNTFKTNTLHLAMVLTFSGFINGAASAMGLADAEQNKSLNLEMNNPITATEVAPPAEIISIAKSKITELPDKLTRVHGRTNNEEDKAYYSFTSTRGQRVMIYNGGPPTIRATGVYQSEGMISVVQNHHP